MISVSVMAPWKVPLADVRLPEEDIDAVAETLRSGWLSMGPRTEELEEALARYTGARHALAVASGTAALHLLCLAVGLGPGDEVVVPSMTFVATVNAIAYTGAKPVFADIAGIAQPWLATSSVRAALTPRTRAVMTVAYGGHPGEARALRDLGDAHGLALLEDAAHAIGARDGGRQIGTLGAGGAYSFFANKNLAIGEGGALTTDDDEIAERARLLRSHGMTTLTWDRHRGHASGYDVVARGFNYRIDEPRAALALRRLERLDAENRRRHALDVRYREGIASIAGVTPTDPPPVGDGALPAHHLFTVVLDRDVDRAAVRAALAARGVQTSVHYPPAHLFSIYADGAPALPHTEEYAARTMTLPMFAGMSEGQQDLVLEALGEALG
ncbi:MAG: DegT/DnrJ/EryC1/StrS aminotransferase family protein [Solirubrobacteraceae bacterium]|nr:DegT/DnrJ/EryC1/StrS aminotransferase family protein [Solirubrobacteraceae bacterium]